VLNAGAAIYAGGAADTLLAGVQAAQEAIDSRAAADKLDQFVDATHQLAGPANATS
jgi:anthranilate phosphoribosyltransferase